ncbi:MAG TPA: hypothetical protein VGB56_07105 [Flavisolibacter sp.]
MEVNHGDAHFSMFDAVQALYNPVMETYIIDAIAMEISGEVFVQKDGLFGMMAVANRMIKCTLGSA